jgi:hypothetical protein
MRLRNKIVWLNIVTGVIFAVDLLAVVLIVLGLTGRSAR